MTETTSWKRSLTASAVAILACVTAMPSLADSSSRTYTERELIEIMRDAQAAPNPVGPEYTREQTGSDAQRSVSVFDLTTGAEWRDSATNTFGELPPDPPFVPGDLGPAVDGIGGAFEGAHRLEDPQFATPPGPFLDSLTHPFDTVAKMLMRFNVDGQDFFYVCSAWTAGSFHAVTAGHCIYNWDPDNDGDTSDAKWADEVWLWFAQTDQVDPIGTPDRPYGEAKAALLRSYVGWTQNQNFDHDWGVVTLNRRDGDHTGWMGRETADSNSLNFTGYPVETPYVPAGTLVQYYGYDVDNVLGYTDERIELDAFIYGGHSGGPSWRYDGTARWVQGIHSTSNRVGYAEDTRLTSGKRTDLNNFMADDEAIRPPIARPDLVEYLFDLDSKDVLDNNVKQGESFDVEYNVLNSGFAASGTFTIDFYLSTNTIISGGDTHIGSRNHSLSAYAFANPTTAFTVPATLAPGDYYVGWIIGSGDTEYTDENNIVVIADETVTVELGDLDLDAPVPGDAGVLNTLELSGAAPGENVTLILGTSEGSFAVPGCPGVFAGVASPIVLDTDAADSNGEVDFSTFVPGSASGRTGYFQAVELDSCRVSDLVTQIFP